VTLLLALAIGALYAAGTYLLLRRSAIRVVFGLALLGYASNLLVFTAGRLSREGPPIVPEGAALAASTSADPLPQALVLTAIVIGFGVQAFALVLLKRTCQEAGTDDVDAMREEP
jgi:multicomponent Na+:H+ antiporter subunit C